jgi:uncharacterized membrane protein
MVLAVLASAWVALVLLAPWVPVPLAGVVYLFGGRICHQVAERSFFLDGAQLPVCARCLGIYLGAAVGLVLPGPQRRARAVLRDPAYVHAVMIVLALNVLTLWSGSNAVRIVAGLALGVVLARAICTVDYERCRPLQRSRSAPPELPI